MYIYYYMYMGISKLIYFSQNGYKVYCKIRDLAVEHMMKNNLQSFGTGQMIVKIFNEWEAQKKEIEELRKAVPK